MAGSFDRLVTRSRLVFTGALCVVALLVGCAPSARTTVVVRPGQGTVLASKHHQPHPRAVWVKGHYAYKSGRYVWVQGHWKH